MDFLGNHFWLIGITILPVITHTFGVTIEEIGPFTAMSLILFKSYKDRVAIHGKRADDSYRKMFMDEWESVLGNSDKANEILNHVEKDWMYTLHLVSSRNEDLILDLIVIIHAKIVALNQAWLYLAIIGYYSQVPTGTLREDCRNVAVHLVIFTYLGSDKLLKSVGRAFDSLLTADKSNIIIKFGIEMKALLAYKFVTIILRSTRDQFERPEKLRIHLIEKLIMNDVLNRERNNLESDIQSLILKLMMGTLAEPGQDERLVKFLEFKQLKRFGAKAKDIKKQLNRHTFKGDYTMVDVIRASFIGMAEIIDLDRRIVAEKFECMIPDNFKIFISDNQIKNNANVEDKYY